MLSEDQRTDIAAALYGAEVGRVQIASFVRAVRLGAGDTITALFDELGDVTITMR